MNKFFPPDFNTSGLPPSALLTQTSFNISFFQIPFTEKKINRILWIKKLILAMGGNTKEGDWAPPLDPRLPGTVHARSATVCWLGCAEGTSLRQGIREASLGVSDAAKDQGLSLAGRQRGRPVIPEDRMGVLSGVWPVRL